MIPTEWLPTYRPEDLELIGYLAPAPAPADAVVPMSLLGTPLGEPMSVFAAEQVLEEAGLGYLAERWLLRGEGPEPGPELEVVVVEATPTQVVVASAETAQVVGQGRVGEQTRLPVPTDRLRPRPR